MMNAAKISTRCLSTGRTRVVHTDRPGLGGKGRSAVTARVVAGWSPTPRSGGVSTSGREGRSVIVENPVPRSEEVHGRHPGDDHQQQPGHRRGVAHVEVSEALLVEVQR